MRADTIRLLRDSRHLIDDEFRHDIRNTSLFIELFKSSQGIHRNLRRMNRYGILGRYLPEFGHIIGQMQHDLFHIYTVDAHTLNLIKHLRKLNRPEMAEKYPLASKIIDRLPKPELIYIAGLYHDIAKAVAATTRNSVRWTPRPSARATSCRPGTPNWCPGWCRTTW
ncbi:PII uridylyl-transferase [Pseudomonas aeruginosa]|nr:PII uridylyl-transferase [Pseudomonas aeruginosa]